MVTFGQLLKTARARKKLTQRAIAEKLGVSTSAVSQWETDETVPDLRRLVEFGLLLDLEIKEMMEAIGTTEGRLSRTEIYTSPKSESLPERIREAVRSGGLPVFSAKTFRDDPEDGDVQWPDGFEIVEAIIDIVHRPPRLREREDVYALYVPGSEMVPWREAGDLIVVDVKRPPKIGDHVIVRMNAENGRFRHLLRKLAGFGDSTFIFHQYRPDREQRLKHTEVVELLRIAEWTELMLEI